jgi:protein SCO1/2
VDHTVNTYLIDSNGKLVQIIPYGTPTNEMLRLVSRLLP